MAGFPNGLGENYDRSLQYLWQIAHTGTGITINIQPQPSHNAMKPAV